MNEEHWVRVLAGRAVSLMRRQGEKVVVYLAGEEMELDTEVWFSLPPYNGAAALRP
jgi:hypothetical protein